MLRRLVLAFAAASLATAALAAGYVAIELRLTPEQMHETGLDTLTPQQLARLNELLRDDAQRAAPVATGADPAPRGTGAPREGEGMGNLLGLSDEPIKSRLVGSISHWEPGTVFVLENGQQWKVLKGGMKLRKPLHAPEVVVAPGLVGRWFLQVDEDLPKARVYRVD